MDAVELPPNLQRLRELLAESGPLALEEASDRLAAAGVVLTADRLLVHVRRHPEAFVMDDAGRVAARVVRLEPHPGGGEEDVEPMEQAWRSALPASLSRRRVAVLDIETTGLGLDEDWVWEFAAVALAGGEELCVRVELPAHIDAHLPPLESGQAALPWDDALALITGFLAGYDAVAGHNLTAFDLPFLAAQVARRGGSWTAPDLVLDLLALSVLDEPSLPHRSLADLCAHHDVPDPRPHRALDDARATAKVITTILDRVDPDDPSWQLAAACLAAGGHPWVSLLGVDRLPPGLEGALRLADDWLLAAEECGAPTTRVATRGALGALEAAGYRRRASQARMAAEVAGVLDDGGRLAVEAPTGTGKSFAYLLPAAARAAIADRPVLVATHTRILQAQLREDAATLRGLGLLPAPFVQLQGVSNYVCTRELAEALEAGVDDPDGWLALGVAVRALATVETGVWDDVTDYALQRRLAGYRGVRAGLRTDTHGCERRSCRWAGACPLLRRTESLTSRAAVVSVNHALLATWVRHARLGPSHRTPGDLLSGRVGRQIVSGAARDRGGPDLVLDEAHDLEDSLTSAWTEEVGARDLELLVAGLGARRGPLRAARAAAARGGQRLTTLAEVAGARRTVLASAAELDAAASEYVREFGGREGLTTLEAGLVRGRPEFRRLSQAAFETILTLRALDAALGAVDQELAGDGPAESPPGVGAARFRLAAARRRLVERIDLLQSLRDLPDELQWVHVLAVEGPEPEDRRWVYRRIPIRVGSAFARDVVGATRSTILTSATLTVDGSFDFLAGRLGVRIEPDAGGREVFRGLRLPGPFDHATQSAVVLTNHLPLPVPGSERQFCEDLAADQVGFLSLTGGRTLTLFAARHRMDQVAAAVRTKEAELAERGVRLLVQHELGTRELAQRFREDPGTVAYGLRSYWQGFDAPGETLSYLVIEKPPYPHPADPIMAARQRAVADVGGDPFLEYTVPKTALLMAQGFGRLVRSEDDRGAALICDRRLQLPTQANLAILNTFPGPRIHYANDRDDAWTTAIEFVTGRRPDLADALVLSINDTAAVLAELRELVLHAPAEALHRGAEQLFGIDALRPEQVALMLAVLEGRDALGFLPTGAGKSLCFQLPAPLRASPEPVVVVSPLIALIKDQVDDLRGRRGLREVQGITSRTSANERTEILRDVAAGKVRLLYVSPERLVHDPTLREALAQQQLGALVVDEAHCISVWGHDFRPEFRQIGPAVKTLRRSGRLGLTATATQQVQRDIDDTLELADPLVVRGAVDRPNLRFWTLQVDDERARARELLRIAMHQEQRPGIVYAGRRATTEEVAALLRRAGFTARHYHAGMVPEQRDAVQEEFFSGLAQVVVATKAFGMGINKADVGWVVHYDLPESLESYAQEAGRAARDPAITGDCMLLWTSRDVARRHGQIAGGKDYLGLPAARRVMASLRAGRPRGEDVTFDPEVVADAQRIDIDELGILLAWLEQAGALRRLPDCTARGAVTGGLREPEDEEERRRFRELLWTRLRARVGMRRLIDFAQLEDEHGLDPDILERDLVRWSLARHITFTTTRRHWRCRLSPGGAGASEHPDTAPGLDEGRYLAQLESWRRAEEDRLKAMTSYAYGSRCRRTILAEHFADRVASCRERADVPACSACARTAPPWHAVSPERVPDPESLVNVPAVTLQAVAWSSAYLRGSYGEVGLRAALLGKDSLGPGRPLGAGLLSCPQFGALRYIRNAERALDETIADLLAKRLVERRKVTGREGRRYATLVLTEAGAAACGLSA